MADKATLNRAAESPPPRGSFFAAAARAVDSAVAVFAPRAALRRAQYRRARASYFEAVKRSRLRRLGLSNPSGDGAAYGNTVRLRAVARDLERNHDIARGALNVLVQNTVGIGIGIEPHPRTKGGALATDTAAALRALARLWMRAPEATGELSWGMTQRMMARAWFRDGEALMQHVEGRVMGLAHASRVPYTIELLEADQLADALTDPARRITQGVERNGWGRPSAYWIFRDPPGDAFVSARQWEAKRILAWRIQHLKHSDRIRQARGISVFASTITRLEDLKDYEESERIAAKVAASMAAMIIKGGPDSWAGELNRDEETGARELKFRPGMVFDDLLPGESVQTIDTQRPNSALGEHRNGQLRAIAAGVGAGYSAISKNYNGTYAAQRQELVEQWGAYAILAEHFTAQFVAPVWRRFVAAAIAAGALAIPADVDLDTVDDALFLAPQMPWIDPLKEATAWQMLEEAGYASGPEIIRRRGQDPGDVLEQEADWRARRAAAGIAVQELTTENGAAASARGWGLITGANNGD